jgi:hypothetical protein
MHIRKHDAVRPYRTDDERLGVSLHTTTNLRDAHRIRDCAEAQGLPPARFVREAVLAAVDAWEAEQAPAPKARPRPRARARKTVKGRQR